MWRVERLDMTVCVKAALPTFRVAHTWQAPVARNAVEVAWLLFAAGHAPEAVPRVLAHDDAAGLSPWSSSTRDNTRHGRPS